MIDFKWKDGDLYFQHLIPSVEPFGGNIILTKNWTEWKKVPTEEEEDEVQ